MSAKRQRHSIYQRLFNSLSTHTTRYGVVDSYDHLYDIINGID